MNVIEGTRRLALLLGLVGAIIGGLTSYIQLQSNEEQRASYDKFEKLAASPVAQQARLSIEAACGHDSSNRECGDATHNPMSEVYSNGIKTIYWGKDYQVELIQTDDGENLSATPAPSAWTYLWVSLFWVVLGFLVPWGAVRAIGWVGAGFTTLA